MALSAATKSVRPSGWMNAPEAGVSPINGAAEEGSMGQLVVMPRHGCDRVRRARGWVKASRCGVSDNVSPYVCHLCGHHLPRPRHHPPPHRPFVPRPTARSKTPPHHGRRRAHKCLYRSENTRRPAPAGWPHQSSHHRAHSARAGQPPITRLDNLAGHHTWFAGRRFTPTRSCVRMNVVG